MISLGEVTALVVGVYFVEYLHRIVINVEHGLPKETMPIIMKVKT